MPTDTLRDVEAIDLGDGLKIQRMEGDGEIEFVCELDGRPVCCVSNVTQEPVMDVYESTGLNAVDALRLMRALAEALRRMSSLIGVQLVDGRSITFTSQEATKIPIRCAKPLDDLFAELRSRVVGDPAATRDEAPA